MTVRTISDLISAEVPLSTDWLEVSRLKQGTKYASMKLSYGALEDSVISSAIVSCTNVWHLPDNVNV